MTRASVASWRPSETETPVLRPVSVEAAPLDRVAAPVLKWAGGKGRLLEQYQRHFPKRYGNYFEPFIGGAAVFFHLEPTRGQRQVHLSDINEELIHLYATLVERTDDLIEALRLHRDRHSHDHYYAVRAQAPGALDPVARAARTLYLNKTCYNGLYRVNASGGFNVPMGRYKDPSILQEGRLRRAALALRGAKLTVEPFEAVLPKARAGDFVYFDPPYQPLSATSNFTSYTRHPFAEAQQRRLSEVFAELAAGGVRVMLSNSDTPLIRELYRDFQQIRIRAPRFINSQADRREAITELLVLSRTRRRSRS